MITTGQGKRCAIRNYIIPVFGFLFLSLGLKAQQTLKIESRDSHERDITGFTVQQGKYLVTISADKFIRWDMRTGLILRKLVQKDRSKPFLSTKANIIVQPSPYGYTLFNTETFAELGSKDSLANVTVSEDGNTIFYVSPYGKDRYGNPSLDTANSFLYDVATKKVQKIRFYESVDMLSGKLLFGRRGNTLELFDVAHDSVLFKTQYDQFGEERIYYAGASESGDVIYLTYSNRKSILLKKTGEHILEFSDIDGIKLSRSGRYLRYDSAGLARLIDVRKKSRIINTVDSVYDVSWSHNEKYFLLVPQNYQRTAYITGTNTVTRLAEIGYESYATRSIFSADCKYFLTTAEEDRFKALESGGVYKLFSVKNDTFSLAQSFPYEKGRSSPISAFDLLPNKFLCVATVNRLFLWDTNTGNLEWQLRSLDGIRGIGIEDIEFINESTIHIKTSDASALVNFKDPAHPTDAYNVNPEEKFDLSKDWKYLAKIEPFNNDSMRVRIFTIDDFTKNHLKKITPLAEEIVAISKSDRQYGYTLKIFPTSNYVLVVVKDQVSIFDRSSGKLIKHLPVAYNHQDYMFNLIDRGKKFVFKKTYDSTSILDLSNLTVSSKKIDDPWDNDVLKALVFNEDSTGTPIDLPTNFKVMSKKYIGYISDRILYFYNTRLKANTGQLFFVSPDNWVCYTEDGFMDAYDPDDFDGLHWLMPDYPNRALPIRIFLKEYFRPGLIADFFVDNKVVVPELKRADILLPSLSFKSVRPNSSQNILEVDISVRSVADTVEIREGNTIKRQILYSGARDLNLQRIVNNRESFADGVDSIIFSNTTAGEKTYRLKVPVPGSNDGDLTLAAYAYNAGDIRSNVVKQTIRVPYRSAYIVGIGVDEYEDEKMNLNFTDDDVELMQATLTGVFKDEENRYCYDCTKFANIYSVNLESHSDTRCTKENIRNAFQTLSGRATGKPTPGLNRAWSDDIVIILMSGHGLVHQATGEFYFLPYDIGKTFSRDTLTEESLNKAISSRELATWIKYIDAERVVLILDACYSGASFEIPGFKSGSWNDKSFAELINNKNIHVIAASQPDNFALESGQIKQSLLTYALFKNGLSDKLADQNKDKRITLKEWFEYAKFRVPQLHKEIVDGKVRAVSTDDNWKNSVTFVAKKKAGTPQVPQLKLYRTDKEFIVLNWRLGY